MPSALLPILPGTLPQGFCPTTEQERLVAYANNMKAVLNGGFSYYNYGADKPAPEFQAYPWLRTTDGRWYMYSGVWRSPNNYSLDERRIWMGSLSDLITYDGGSAGTVSATTGPMWVEDTSMIDRIPIGAGSTAAIGVNAGSASVTLTPDNMNHWHGVGTDGGIDDPPTMIRRDWTSPNNFTRRINDLNTSGSTGWMDNTTPFSSGTMGSTEPFANTTSPTAFSVIPPVKGVYFVKPSGRLYYVVP